MMKSTVEQLSDNEREALAHLYELPGYKAFVKLCRMEIVGLGADALNSQDHELTRYYSGQATMASKLPKIIRELHKELNKQN